jgi:nicotinate-nucleotide pyrophosphorylase (carboxylating)
MIKLNFSKEEIIHLEKLFAIAVQEDLKGSFENDITFKAIGAKDEDASYVITARQNLVLCGIDIIKHFASIYAKSIEIKSFYEDGQNVTQDFVFAKINGKISEILAFERIALNILQRLCGIATITNKYQTLISHTKSKIKDTRKTLPAFRLLDKYAVKVGGGVNHRFGLFDKILVKDNHIAFLEGDLEKAILNIKEFVNKNPKFSHFEIECDNLSQIELCLNHKVPEILLDNMKLEEIKLAVLLKEKISPTTLLEASGGLNEKNIITFAEAGVDFLSLGSLTHSVKSVDIGLDENK